MLGQFIWTNFYMEFASKLLEYRDNRAILLKKIQGVYVNRGMKLPKLDKKGIPNDIDPFTIFGLFNKRITDANRVMILEGIALEFGIAAEIPNDFSGIPVLNNMKATFYAFEGDERRKDGDIDKLDLRPGFDSEGFRAYQAELDNEKFDRLVQCVESLNEKIAADESLGEGFCIGHSYFCNIAPDKLDDNKLSGIVEYELIPMLKEYWYDEPLRVKEWSNLLRSAIK